ncbi:hypothetical protein V8C40DRAFT_118407 [Trichoderma camerunense]
MLLWVLGEYSKSGRLANRYSMYYFVGLADPAECRQTDALRDRTLAEGQKKPTEKSKGTGRSSSFTECIRKRANKLTIDRTVRGLLAVRYRHKVQAQPQSRSTSISKRSGPSTESEVQVWGADADSPTDLESPKVPGASSSRKMERRIEPDTAGDLGFSR